MILTEKLISGLLQSNSGIPAEQHELTDGHCSGNCAVPTCGYHSFLLPGQLHQEIEV